MKIVLSYPRSGNHLMRFFIELITEQPTAGCVGNKNDVEIYKNIFDIDVPFNIGDNKKHIYHKYHEPPDEKNLDINDLILIIRNPKEVLLGYNNYTMHIDDSWNSFNVYYKNIDFYLKFDGNKKLFFYEDIITNKINFIKELYSFLNIDNPQKLKYILDNIELLYEASKTGKNREWQGVNSIGVDFYYKEIKDSGIKKEFDEYIREKANDPKYEFLSNRYNLNITEEDDD